MKYTTQNSFVNQAIQGYLDQIVKVILKELPQAKSIILGGGFGRGEGSVWLKKNTVIPINDFDMFVVAEKNIDEERLNLVANQASKSLPVEIGSRGTDFYSFDRSLHANTFYVDLKVLPIKKLADLPPMFRYFELKNASVVLWGKDYRDLMPDYQVKDLPLIEGFRLLLNRMAMLCLYFSLDFTKRPMSLSEKHGLLYLASKSLVDLSAPLLQLNGQYLPTYLGRLKNLKKTYKKDFPELYKQLPDLVEKVQQATDFKIKPDFKIKVNAFQYWTMCKKYIGKTSLYFAKTLFGRKIKSYSALSDLIYKELWKIYYSPYLKHFLKSKFKINFGSLPAAFLLQRYLNFLVYQRFCQYTGINYPRILINNRGFDLIIYSAMTRLLYSVDEKGKIDAKMLAQARKILEKTFPVVYNEPVEPFGLWNAVNNAFSCAYANFSFLKIV